MATFRGDARAVLERALTEKRLPEKVEALEEAVVQLVVELEYVLAALGPENFSSGGLKELMEGMK